jgi:protein associated with RNAse G/E
VIDLFLGFKLDIDISGTYEIELFEHGEYKTKEKKLKLEREAATLAQKEAAIQAQFTFLTNRTVSLLYKCNALAVELGL